MTRADAIQTSFTTGEISSQFQARTDHQKRGSALRKSINALILPQGPVIRRPGFRYVAPVKDANNPPILVSFKFNVTQNYVIEIGDRYMRFFTNEGQLQDSISGKGITNGTFSSDLSGWTNSSTGTGAVSQSAGLAVLAGGAAGTNQAILSQQLAQGLGVGSYTVTLDVGVNTVQAKVGTTPTGNDIASASLTVGAGKTFTFNILTSTNAPVYISFQNANFSTSPTIDSVVLTLTTARVYEIATPYLYSQITGLKFTQSADVLYITHPSHVPRQLNRLGASQWNYNDLVFTDGPFDPTNADASKTLTSSAAGNLGTAVTITATGHTPFTSSMVGSLIRHQRVGQWRSILITAFTSSTSVNGTFQDDNPTGYTAGASSAWRLGSWSTTKGWPAVCAFFQQRLMFANNAANPQKVWGSVTGVFTQFSPTNADGTVTDDRGVDYLIASDQVNSILWMSPGKVLIMGTAESEFILRAGTLDNPEALTPTNAIALRTTSVGSASTIPVVRPTSNTVIFVNRSTNRVHEFSYDYSSADFVAPELSLLSRHLTNLGISAMTYADNVVWFALSSGDLISMTYLKSEEVVGFAQHPLGGSGDILSLASMIASDVSYTQVWGVVKRIIGGNFVTNVEYMENLFNIGNNKSKSTAFLVDCGLSYTGSPVNTVSGLSHLNNQAVAVLADGAPLNGLTVSGGSLSLGGSYSNVHVGLPTYFEIATLDPDIGGEAGTGIGKTKRCDKVKLKLIDTITCKVGRDEDHLDSLDLSAISSNGMFNGFARTDFDDDYTEDLQIVVRCDDPTPISVAAVLMDLTVHEQ